MEEKNNNNNMVQRCIYTVNVVKNPVKIQFFGRFHWRNESKANEGTKARPFSFP